MTFLEQCARHYYELEGGIGKRCFIFPNRRSLVFFEKALCRICAEKKQPAMLPALYTEDDFIHALAGARKTDKVHLLLELHEVYKGINPEAESLDDFVFWGNVILGDFDDIDKYLVNPEHIFTNIKEFRGLQGPLDYLSPEQEEAVRRFAGHFNTGGYYKERFRAVWDMLLPLYRGFGAALASRGLSYEGQVYRSIADALGRSPVSDLLPDGFKDMGFVFIGLNALNECEKTLLRKLRDAGLAEFCWDYQSSLVRHPEGRASVFMEANLKDFPQAFPLDDSDVGVPEVNVVSVPSASGQAKQLPSILAGFPDGADIRSAVVLPDESLLLNVLNSIPEDIEDINVTMGYPMKASALWSLMNQISDLQLHTRRTDGRWYFYHKQVLALVSNGLVEPALGDAGRQAVENVRADGRYYVDEARLKGDPVLEAIFTPVAEDASVADPAAIRALQEYQRRVISTIAPRLKNVEGMALELEFAREYYLAVNRLGAYELNIKPSTYFRLLGQLCGGSSVPFKGEPVKGLQIMGPLETRALDFENIVILSCNEGVFPRRNVSPSFVPPELRKGFGLPTYEYQDSVWAYYFYRLIQRCKRLWLLYDSRTEMSRSGEPSRYILQLEMHFGVKLNHYVAKAPIRDTADAVELLKTDGTLAALKAMKYSATALQAYINCPASFFYRYVQGLREQEELSEFLDHGMIGNVFHDVMFRLYSDRSSVSREYLRECLGKRKWIKALVRESMLRELKSFELKGRNIVFEDLITRYVVRVLERDLEYLESREAGSFTVHGLERQLSGDIDGYAITGRIDRLDSLDSGELRIVDYKTGKVSDEEVLITPGKAGGIVEKAFKPGNDWPKAAIQLYIYDVLAHQNKLDRGRRIINSIYGCTRLFTHGVEGSEAVPEFLDAMSVKVSELLAEINDPRKGFGRVGDPKRCGYCDFKRICGR